MASFENVKSSPAAGYINHTPGHITVNEKTEIVDNPSEVNRLNNWPLGSYSPDPIGVGTMLWVHPGDVKGRGICVVCVFCFFQQKCGCGIE